MAEKLINSDTLQAIADAIREKKRDTEAIPVTDFAREIKSLEVTEGGGSADDIVIYNQDLTITENGTYTAGEGYTGLGTVTVEVASGGGGENKLVQMVNGTATELTAEDLVGVTKIPQYLFQTNKNIRSVSLSDTVTSIGMYAFADSEIRTIDLASVTYIGESAFYRCNGSSYQLNNLVLPSTITTIGSRAFQQCLHMKTVVVQGNIPLSSSNLFAYNTALTTVTVISTTPPTLSSSAFDGCTALKEIIVPRGCGDAYKSATNWSAHASKIVEGDI